MAKYKIIPSSRTIVQSPISIGHKAEKGVEAIEFDLTAWVETYGSGTLTVIMRRWGDAIPYPIALEIDENNKATWTLSDIDTAKAGMAYAQLSYVVGETVVKKSDIYTFRVMDSLTGEGEPPEAYESWLEHLTHFAAEAMAEVLDVEGIVTDKTLTVDGGIADAKAAGDALALKADKSTTYTKVEVDALIDEVEVETDTTLEVAGAAADAAETGRQIGLLKADLDAQTGVIGLIKGYYIQTSDTPISLVPQASSAGRMYAVVDCTAGDKFVINAYSSSSRARAWCFIDSANNAISMAETQAVATDLELTAPNNAAKLIINDMSGGMNYKVGYNLANWIGGTGLSQDARAALLTCLEHVAWIDEHGQTYYNALKDALYPGYWDYEWDATSGVAPSKYFDSYEHDFIKYPDAMYADNFYFDFNHVGDVDILFVAKMATEADASSVDRTPQISVMGAQGSNGYDGFKAIFNTKSRKVETNLSGDFVSTNIDYTNYHEYRAKYENGVGYLYVDGILVAQGTGVTNNQYIYMTGIAASALDKNGHPNISVSIPYTRMAIKSVKYKGLS